MRRVRVNFRLHLRVNEEIPDMTEWIKVTPCTRLGVGSQFIVHQCRKFKQKWHSNFLHLFLASPQELVQEVRGGLPDYALRRLVAIGATQVLLCKHLDQVAAIDTKLGLLYAERATMQIRCQIENQRLIQLFYG